MTQASISLTDLVEHGSLPFVGREREIQLIVDFWRSTILAERLRALIITGEAGSGKSRLLEAVIPIIAQQGGAVAHLKLYHDATAAIAPLVLESLRSSNLFRHVSRSGSGTPLSMAAQALRRIARLRPLLLVVEDIQLLEGEALQELNQLLEMMADEPISALFATRPVKQGARGIVERHLVDEITLGGLHRDGIAEMWRSVLGEPPAQEILDQLYHATLGNPLALRSAFREALKYRHATRDELPGLRDTPLPGELLQHALEHRVGLLAEGMVAHLDSRELRAATELASVGEVFARESAMALGSDIAGMLEPLQQKGIISVLTTPALPVGEVYSRYPLLAFSHSLIHKHLSRQGSINAGQLIQLICAGVPLYSLLPFQLLLQAQHLELPTLSADMLQRIVEAISPVIRTLCNGPDWKLASPVWQVLERLVYSAKESISHEDFAALELEVYHQRLDIFRREDYSDEYEIYVRRFLELTAGPTTEKAARMRLCALDNLMAMENIVGKLSMEYIWNEGEKVLEQFPEVIATRRYVLFLSAVSFYSKAGFDQYVLPLIGRKLELIRQSEYTTGDVQWFAWYKLSAVALRHFATPEELQSRRQQMAELNREVTLEDWFFLMEEVSLLESIGEMDEVLASYERWNAQILARGLHRTARSRALIRLRAMATMGAERRMIDEEISHLMLHPIPLPPTNRIQFGRAFAGITALCGNLDWSRDIVQRVPESQPFLSTLMKVILALDEQGANATLGLLEVCAYSAERGEPTYYDPPEDDIETLVRVLVGPELIDAGVPDVAAAVRALDAILGRHVLRITDVLRLSTAMRLVDAIETRFPELGLFGQVAPALLRSLVTALEWTAERKLPPVIRMLLDNHATLLTPKQRTLWNNRFNAVAAERGNLFAADTSRPPLVITMIGTISVTKLRGEPHRLRGERMRVLLALMVADTIMAKHLPHEEFAAIATGIEDDPEAARLSLTHMVYRLRETIGTQAVITASSPTGPAAPAAGLSTPQLNLAVVDVDLIRAWRALQTANEALADGFLVKAARCLTEVIDTIGTEIVFPTLYDSFFEALRTDFEGRLHQLLLAVVSRLAEEGDAEGGEALLQRGFAMMPDDEEIAERLQEMLIRLERHADADRIRVRAQRSLRG